MPTNLTHLSLCNVHTKEIGWLPRTLTHLKLRFFVDGSPDQQSIAQLMDKKLLADLPYLTHLYLGTFTKYRVSDPARREQQVSFDELDDHFFPRQLTHLYLDIPLKTHPQEYQCRLWRLETPMRNGKISSMIVNMRHLVCIISCVIEDHSV